MKATFLFGLFQRKDKAAPKRPARISVEGSNSVAWVRLHAYANSGLPGCRDAQIKLREAAHAGLRQATGRPVR